jgi:hypothetical protein
MNAGDPRLLTYSSRTGAWLTRAVLAVLGVVLAVVAFFFITAALVAGAFIALGIALRWWWVMRRLRAAAKASAPLEGEFRILEEHSGHSQRLDR